MLAFGGVLSALRRRSAGVRILAVAASWTVFELARSSGFLGYPWVLSAHSQYLNPAVMQLAELTGVWGVSFVVVLVNAALAELALAAPSRLRSGGLRLALLAVFALVGLTHLGGAVVLAAENRYPAADEQVRVALVQQNSDPRKHDYEQTFASLRRLSDEALRERPDLIAWSETAFVPNIRRWGEEDPRRYRLARLVREFREYQAGLGTWLLTGNDDYRRVLDEDGMEIERLSYNASVLFSDAGERRETYHKIKLVPFTEHFPFEEELPAVYAALEAFDVHFWEPGRERVVFRHPKFSFATPICFEDVFPNEVRAFVNEGAEVILNLTNDYWSLTEVQARQHFAASIFRSVENRRPLLRSTASGLTAHVDPYGRVVDTRPQYSEQVLLAELSVSNDPPMTLYTRAGDWFPLAAAVLLAGLLVSGLRRRRRRDYGSADSC
jgi:apolipoprotein N-acyltransferase